MRVHSISDAPPIYKEEDLVRIIGNLSEDVKQKSAEHNYNELLDLIKALRNYLEILVVLKQDLTDPAVLFASQTLDEALNLLNGCSSSQTGLR